MNHPFSGLLIANKVHPNRRLIPQSGMGSKRMNLLDPTKNRLLAGRDRKKVDVKGLEAFLLQVSVERLTKSHFGRVCPLE